MLHGGPDNKVLLYFLCLVHYLIQNIKIFFLLVQFMLSISAWILFTLSPNTKNTFFFAHQCILFPFIIVSISFMRVLGVPSRSASHSILFPFLWIPYLKFMHFCIEKMINFSVSFCPKLPKWIDFRNYLILSNLLLWYCEGVLEELLFGFI